VLSAGYRWGMIAFVVTPSGARSNLCALVAELDEGERNGVEEEHCAYLVTPPRDGPSDSRGGDTGDHRMAREAAWATVLNVDSH
jgi:hypothetical protein